MWAGRRSRHSPAQWGDEKQRVALGGGGATVPVNVMLQRLSVMRFEVAGMDGVTVLLKTSASQHPYRTAVSVNTKVCNQEKCCLFRRCCQCDRPPQCRSPCCSRCASTTSAQTAKKISSQVRPPPPRCSKRMGCGTGPSSPSSFMIAKTIYGCRAL